jgi:ribosomal protein L11 methyltransferase
MDYIELKIDVKPSDQAANEIIIAQLAELGFESFTENDSGLSAFIKAPDYTNDVELTLKKLFLPEGTQIAFQTNRIKGQNWNAQWEANFEPIIVDNRCLVRASFHKSMPELEYEIIIDPKMAFGTGHHQTTHLMIEAILNENLTNKTVLDMGCGTGVLAILAEMKGASAITAIDIDDWAYLNTLENIQVNRCVRIETFCGDVKLIEGKGYDTILANINLNILLSDIPYYEKSLLPDGKLLLSGILKSDIEAIKQKADENGLTHLSTATRDEWVRISFQKSC